MGAYAVDTLQVDRPCVPTSSSQEGECSERQQPTKIIWLGQYKHLIYGKGFLIWSVGT